MSGNASGKMRFGINCTGSIADGTGGWKSCGARRTETRVGGRHLLAGVGALALIAGLRALWSTDAEAAGNFQIQKSDSEWRAILPKAQYDVLRRHRTEPAGSSPLNDEKRKGPFASPGCQLPLFSSETKY